MMNYEIRRLFNIFTKHNIPVSIKLRECNKDFKQFSGLLKQVLTGLRVPMW